MKSIPEQVRTYGGDFDKNQVKLGMPKIWWNAEIRSVRPLSSLQKIHFLNYKMLFGDGKEQVAHTPTE